MAAERARRGFTEHIIIVPGGTAVEVTSRAAEALAELRTLSA